MWSESQKVENYPRKTATPGHRVLLFGIRPPSFFESLPLDTEFGTGPRTECLICFTGSLDYDEASYPCHQGAPSCGADSSMVLAALQGSQILDSRRRSGKD